MTDLDKRNIVIVISSQVGLCSLKKKIVSRAGPGRAGLLIKKKNFGYGRASKNETWFQTWASEISEYLIRAGSGRKKLVRADDL